MLEKQRITLDHQRAALLIEALFSMSMLALALTAAFAIIISSQKSLPKIESSSSNSTCELHTKGKDICLLSCSPNQTLVIAQGPVCQ